MPVCVSHHPSLSSDGFRLLDSRVCLALPQTAAPEHSSYSKIFLLGCVPGGRPLLQLLNSSCYRCSILPGLAHSGSEWRRSPAVLLRALNLSHCPCGPCCQLKKVLCVSLSLIFSLTLFYCLKTGWKSLGEEPQLPLACIDMMWQALYNLQGFVHVPSHRKPALISHLLHSEVLLFCRELLV